MRREYSIKNFEPFRCIGCYFLYKSNRAKNMEAIDLQFGFSRARNNLHIAVHRRLLKAFTKEWATRYNVLNLRKEYMDLFKLESKIHFHPRNYQNTPEITAAKEKCDSTFQYICTHIRNQARNPNKNRQEAAERLEYIISPFKNVSRETMLGASGAYYKFLASMQQESLTADVKLLDLDEPLAILQADLETFNELFQARSLVKLENIHEPMREIRRQVDETFRAWATFVNSLYCVNYYLDQDAAKAQELLQLINKVNGILNETGETLIRLGHAYKPVSKQKEKDKETEKDKEDKEKKEV